MNNKIGKIYFIIYCIICSFSILTVYSYGNDSLEIKENNAQEIVSEEESPDDEILGDLQNLENDKIENKEEHNEVDDKKGNDEEKNNEVNNKNEIVDLDIQSKILEKEIKTELTYSTHIQDIGWQNFVKDSELSGTTGKSLRVEAIKIDIETNVEGNIEYSTHIQNIGWQDYVANGNVAGTTGKSLRMEAIRIRLTGNLEKKYDIYYRTHIQEIGWLGWAKNDEKAGTQGNSYRMEAIQIKLVEKGSQINIEGRAFVEKPLIKYKMHVQDIGWQGYVNDGDISGTQGRNLRAEAIKVELGNSDLEGKIKYSTHIQNIGWTSYVENGNVSGTEGKSLRLEGIKIKLTDELEKYFDIYYRSYVQNFGWLAWAKNGEESGTEGYSYRMEAIQILIIPKGGKIPGNTNGHFYNKALEKKSVEGIKMIFGPNTCVGIDVSHNNGTIDWKEINKSVDFAIVRCGYGINVTKQDDREFEANMQGCIGNSIPIDVYLYSYADTTEKAISEAEHVVRLCKKYKKHIRKIWYDVEDSSVFNQIAAGRMSTTQLGNIIDAFSSTIKANGYKVGLYTYTYALKAYFPNEMNNKYDIWIANYPEMAKDVFANKYNSYKSLYEMWQFTSTGVVNGVNGKVDLNIKF